MRTQPSRKRHRLPYTRICATAMERFGLSRHDLMTMTWTQVSMLFDATYDDPEAPKGEEVRYATDQDIMRWI